MTATRLNAAVFSDSGCPFPVGALYLTMDERDPSELWAGTEWSRLAQGTFLAASGEGADYGLGKEGGAASVKLTDAQMAHGHGFTQPTVNGGAGTNNITGGSHAHNAYIMDGVRSAGNGSSYWYNTSGTTQKWATASATHTHSLPAHTHSVSGGAVANLSGAANTRTAHENRPPYIAVAMWRRTK